MYKNVVCTYREYYYTENVSVAQQVTVGNAHYP